MDLLKKLAVTGLVGLIALVIGGMVLIVSESGGRGGMAKPLLVVRPIFVSQKNPAQPSPAPELPPPASGRGKAETAHSTPSASVGQGENLWGGQSAQLVIVIDDIGHNMAAARRFLSLKLPLTYSILPGLKHSQRAGELIIKKGGEFLVHLPMEPDYYPSVDPGPQPMLLAEGDAGTRKRLQRYFEHLPAAIGASNHMGSAYTRNEAKMRLVQSVLARQGRVFLNSLTSNSKVPRKIARSHGFDYLERNIFLDNQRREGAIRRQLNHALRLARRRGRAIAIGHPYRETRRVLAHAFPAHRPADTPAGQVELVPLSALLRR